MSAAHPDTDFIETVTRTSKIRHESALPAQERDVQSHGNEVL